VISNLKLILLKKELVIFEVQTAIGTKMAVFWVVVPCSLVEIYQRFRGSCCLHHQGKEFLAGLVSSNKKHIYEMRFSVKCCL
jgi:hypothetical protein